MSVTDLTRPLSVRVFLFDDTIDTVDALTRSFNEFGVAQSAIQGLRSLSTSAFQTVNHQIATVANEFLHVDLGNLLISGWRKYTELTKAAERTLATPGSEEVAFLATHCVTSIHHPSVDLLVDGAKVHTFEFELKVVFDINGAGAVLRQGDLVALRGGGCVVTATLTLEKTRLKVERTGRIDLPLLVRLHRPLPLAQQCSPSSQSAATARRPSVGRS